LNGDGKISKAEFRAAALKSMKDEEAVGDTTTDVPATGTTAPNTDNKDDTIVNPVGDNKTLPAFIEPTE